MVPPNFPSTSQRVRIVPSAAPAIGISLPRRGRVRGRGVGHRDGLGVHHDVGERLVPRRGGRGGGRVAALSRLMAVVVLVLVAQGVSVPVLGQVTSLQRDRWSGMG